MLSDVLIIKMGQYIPLDPLTPLNGMMINYIIKRSCATHLWARNLRLKIKQTTPVFPVLKLHLTHLGNMARVPHMAPFWSTLISKRCLGSQTYLLLVAPTALHYAETTYLKKIQQTWLIYDFITLRISFQSAGKGVFPTTLVITTSWKPSPAVLSESGSVRPC